MGFRDSRRAFGAILMAAGTWASAAGVLETPSEAGESGIGLIAGWHCTAQIIEVQIDQGPLIKAGSGTLRPDTASVCGHPNTGFGLTYNYNVHAPGTHTVSVYADGVLFAKRFLTTYSYGVEYLQGVRGAFAVPDFPVRGTSTIVSWSEPRQNFTITEIRPTASSDIRPFGTWIGVVRRSPVDTRCGVDLRTATAEFEEAASTVVVLNEGPDAMRVQISTPRGTCSLKGPVYGAQVSWTVIPEFSSSDLSCLGNASWNYVYVSLLATAAGFPPSTNERVLALSLRAQAPLTDTCPVQWISFHGATAAN